MRRQAVHALALVPFLLAALHAASAPQPEGPDPLTLAEEALARGAHDEALSQLAAARAAFPERGAEVGYLAALAQLRAGRPEEALEACASLGSAHPDSPWARRAAWLAAEAHLARRGYAEAAAALRGALDGLVAPARREAIAQAYLEVAAELEASEAPPRATLCRLLGNARDLKALDDARDLEVLGRMVAHAVAAAPEDPELSRRGAAWARSYLERREDPGVRVALGRLLAHTGDPWGALEAFEAVADGAPRTPVAAEALHRAAGLFGEQAAPGGELLSGVPDLEHLYHATRLLDRLEDEAPGHPLAVLARLERAVLQSRFGELVPEAIEGLRGFVRDYPGHERVPEARVLLGELLSAASRSAEAVQAWEAFLAEHTTHPAWPEVAERVRRERLAEAVRLAAAGRREEAVGAYRAFVAAWPQDERSPEAAFQIGQALADAGQIPAALDQWGRVASRYPGSEAAAHATYATGRVLEDRLEWTQALEAYARVQGGTFQGPAREREAALRAPSLGIAVGRGFGSAERPRVTITSRNLEEYEVLIHRVDARDYFHRTLSTGGILDLDVAIAEPDHREGHSVEGYAPFRPHEWVWDLPPGGLGVTIVTARNGPLEASNAVLVTDLAVLVLASRQAATVLGVDLRDGAPLEDLPYTVAADGRLVAKGAGLGGASRASLFVDLMGHHAFRDLDLAGLPMAPTPADGALVLTDRTVYAPGEEVHAVAIVRRPEGEALVPGAGPLVLEALAPSHGTGLPYARAEGTPDEEGCIELRLRLPEDFAVGAWGLVLREAPRGKGRVLARSAIHVAPEAPPPAWRTDLEAEPAEPAWGEAARLTVRVRDRFGRPLAGSRLVWRLQGWPAHLEGEALTDASGALRLEVPAVPYLGAETRLHVTMPDGAVREHVLPWRVPTARLEVELEGLPLSPVGEERAVRVRVHGVVHAPRYRILRAGPGGGVEERATGELALDEAGSARTAWTPDAPGGYTVVVTGRDGRGLPLSAQAPFAAAETGDAQALFLQVPSTRAVPGADLGLRVYSAFEMPGYVAVLTDGVASHRAVRLEPGWNALALAAPDVRWTRFQVAAWGLRDDRLHSASATLDLDRGLQVAIAPPVGVPAGGEEVPLELRVTDEQGRPVRARVNLVVGPRPELERPVGVFRREWQGPYLASDASSRTRFEAVTRRVADEALRAMDEVANAAGRAYAPVHGLPLPSLDGEVQDHHAYGARRGQQLAQGGWASQEADGGGWGWEKEARPMEAWRDIHVAMDVATDAEGRARFPVRLPLEGGAWEVRAYAWAGDRSGGGEATLAARERLAVVVPPMAHVGAEAALALVGEGKVEVEVGGERTELSLAPGREAEVRFTPAEAGELRVVVRSGGAVGEYPIPVLAPEGDSPLALAAAHPYQRAQAAAARLLAAPAGEGRLRSARVAELASWTSPDPLDLEDAVALALALDGARRQGEAIQEERLHALVAQAATALEGRPEWDARVLRRALISMVDELQAIHLVPFFRERSGLSARALAWLAGLYARLDRTEERDACLSAMDEAMAAGRAFEAIGVLDGEGVARAFVARARGTPAAEGGVDAAAGVGEALSPFEAALWAPWVADASWWATARRARPTPGLAADRLRVYAPVPLVDGRHVPPVSEDIEGGDLEEGPGLGAGEEFRMTLSFEVSDATARVEEPLPDGWRLLEGGGLVYDPRRHALTARLPAGRHEFACRLYAVTADPAPRAIHPETLAALALHHAGRGDPEGVLRELGRLQAVARATGELAVRLARSGFEAAAALGRGEEAILWLEALKEADPAAEIPPDRARLAAGAYEAAGEPLAAADLYRALLDEAYLQEALLPGELEALGRTEEARAWNERLLSAAAGTTLNRRMIAALAQRQGQAGGAHRALALGTYRRYLAHFPQADDHDAVAFALAGLYLALDSPPDAERVAAATLGLHPESRLVRELRLLRAVALYAQRRFDAAREVAEALAGEGEKAARLLVAQLLHAQGRNAEALEAYREVAALFPDARRAAAFLEQSGIAVPELTVVRSGEPAGVDLDYLGVGELDLRLYRVDLVQLYLRAQGDVDLGRIEVAGFRPALSQHLALARPSGTARLRQRVPLELGEPGAYYLTARAGSFGASGLVLVSDLALELQEEPGHLRVYVSDARLDGAAPNASVAFIRRASPVRIDVERTDLRGVAEVAGAAGQVTVVAERDGHVAFARLQVAPERRGKSFEADKDVDVLRGRIQDAIEGLEDRQGEYEGNVQQRNRSIRLKQR
ncbi:MAG: tetratricopeptide repeat protein [Planctomycetes bacterium]|nr:tetratricopeptide repeat protein [Planctomycetota bacterium]